MQTQDSFVPDRVSITTPSPCNLDGDMIKNSSSSGETSGPCNLASSNSTTISGPPVVRTRISLSEFMFEMKASNGGGDTSTPRHICTEMQAGESLQRLRAAKVSENALSIFPSLVRDYGLKTGNWLVTILDREFQHSSEESADRLNGQQELIPKKD